MTANAIQSPDLADTLFAAVVALTPGRTVRLALEMWSYGADSPELAGTLARGWVLTILSLHQWGSGTVLRAEYHDAAGLVSQVREHMAAHTQHELTEAVAAHRAAEAAASAQLGTTDGSEEMAQYALIKAADRVLKARAALVTP